LLNLVKKTITLQKWKKLSLPDKNKSKTVTSAVTFCNNTSSYYRKHTKFLTFTFWPLTF